MSYAVGSKISFIEVIEEVKPTRLYSVGSRIVFAKFQEEITNVGVTVL